MIPPVLHGLTGVVQCLVATPGAVPATAQSKEGYALAPGDPPSLYVVQQ